MNKHKEQITKAAIQAFNQQGNTRPSKESVNDWLLNFTPSNAAQLAALNEMLEGFK